MEWGFPIHYHQKIGQSMTYRGTDLSGTPTPSPGPKLKIDDDSKAIMAIASGIAKSILYICLTVFLCFYVSSCNLDSEVIKQCEQSCSTSGNRMKSVSNSTCECTSRNELENGLKEDIWVLPKTSQ